MSSSAAAAAAAEAAAASAAPEASAAEVSASEASSRVEEPAAGAASESGEAAVAAKEEEGAAAAAGAADAAAGSAEKSEEKTGSPGDGGDDAGRLDRVRDQLEFYFGDHNYPTDNFMKTTAAANGGAVPLDVLAKFFKLKQVCGTTDAAELGTIVVASLSRDGASELVGLTEDQKSVKRLTPIPESLDLTPQTTYSKGWLRTTTTDEIRESMSVFGPIGRVTPRTINKKFKGSALIEYRDVASAEKANAAEGHTHNGRRIYTESKKHWQEEKAAYEASERQKKAVKRKQEDGAGAAGGDDDDAEGEGGDKRTKLGESDDVTSNVGARDDSIVVSLGGLGEGVSREDIREQCQTHGPVRFIDYSRDDTSGFVRMDDQAAADALVKACQADGVFILGFAVKDAKVLEGEELDAYWTKYAEEARARVAARAANPRSRGGRGRGRGGRGRGGRR